jgi:hypothetical protein
MIDDSPVDMMLFENPLNVRNFRPCVSVSAAALMRAGWDRTFKKRGLMQSLLLDVLFRVGICLGFHHALCDCCYRKNCGRR